VNIDSPLVTCIYAHIFPGNIDESNNNTKTKSYNLKGIRGTRSNVFKEIPFPT